MFLVCGEALWDLFATDRDDGLAFDARMGGAPFNVAVGLARLGQASALLGGVSNDPLGDRLAAALAAEGVATDYLRRSDHPTTLSVVTLARDGQPAYAFYGHGAADRMVSTADLPPLPPEIWGLYAGSYTTVVEPVGAAYLSLFERESGQRLLMLDPNVRLNVEPDTQIWRNRVDAFARRADVIKVSDEDLGLLYPGRAPADIAAEWRAGGAGLVIVTRGGDGAEAFAEAGHVAIKSDPVAVIDTVGAGDTFMAGTVTALHELNLRSRAAIDRASRHDLRRVVAFATFAAATTCTRRGADLPRRIDLPPLSESVS